MMSQFKASEIIKQDLVPASPMMEGEQAGQYLARVREELRIHPDRVAQETCIKPDYVRAIEASDFDALPNSAFTLGYARTIAEFLGADGELVLQRCKQEIQENAAERIRAMSPKKPSFNQNFVISLIVAIVLVSAFVVADAATTKSSTSEMIEANRGVHLSQTS